MQQDGLITEVESQGHAFEAGLRQNSRLVEVEQLAVVFGGSAPCFLLPLRWFSLQICKIVVSTLSYDQMVDLLKTSSPVVVTVVPAAADDSPRRSVISFASLYCSVLTYRSDCDQAFTNGQ